MEMSKEERARLQNFIAQNGYIMVPRDFFLVMSSDAAFFLSYLINQAKRHKAEEKKDGWFYCTIKKVQKYIYMNVNKQRKVMLELQGKRHIPRTNGKVHIRVSRHVDENNRFIWVERRGMPSKRWFKIDWNTLCQKMDEANKKLEEIGQ